MSNFGELEIRIRYSYLSEMGGKAEIQKAFALALFIRYFNNAAIPRFSFNKLHEITGLHVNTLKKRINILKRLGIVKLVHDCLVVYNISTRHKKKNFKIPYDILTACRSVKHIEKVVRQFLVVKINLNKAFAKHNQDTLNNPRNLKEFRKARRISRFYGYGNDPYVENGLSYDGIAKKLGVSRKTAVKVVKSCVEDGLLTKTRNFEQIFHKGKVSKGKERYGFFTFSTKNNAYIVHANTYSLTPSLASFYSEVAIIRV